MAFDIVKGWPSEGALDEMFEQDTGEDLSFGDVAWLTSDKAAAADYSTDGSDAGNMFGVVVDVCKETGKVTLLLSDCIVECDADHYVAGSYAVGDKMSAAGGKFTEVATSAKEIGRIIAYNATTGIMRIHVAKSL